MGSEAGPSESIGKEYVSWDSPAIGRRMEVNIWGSDAADHACIVFPSSEGRFFQYEDEGMIGAMWHLIESKRLQLFCVDSIDSETFFAGWKRAEDRARRHLDYERYIMEEVLFLEIICHFKLNFVQVVPFVRKRGDPARRLGATGVSWGGYHCVNSIFKFPEVFSFCVSMSGVRRYPVASVAITASNSALFTVSLRDLLGDFVNDDVYFNDPTMVGFLFVWTLDRASDVCSKVLAKPLGREDSRQAPQEQGYPCAWRWPMGGGKQARLPIGIGYPVW